MASHSVTKLTEEQYLALERAAEFKSEYFDGEMFAMPGASLQHARLQRNLSVQLYIALSGPDCEAFGSDLRVRVSGRMYTYPDISVVSGKPLLKDDHQDVLLNPVVIFEVLSPSRERLQHYGTVKTLQDYILADQSQIRIEHYTRQDDNVWTVRDYQSMDDTLTIASIGVSLSLAKIYDRVELPAG